MPKLAAVRLLAAVVLLSALTSTIFAAGLASPAVASPVGWSSGTLIDPHPGVLLSISCPTATFCAAVDLYGNVFTYDGSSWSSPDRIDPGEHLASVSCPAANFCAAVDGGGNVLTYNGTSWSSPDGVAAAGSLESVSCPTNSFCVAVEYGGNVFTYDGSSWSSPDSVDPGKSPSSVSCPTASFCAAVDASGNAFTYDGTSWSSPDSIDPNGSEMSSVSCPTASFCAAVDGNGNVLTYNGTSWSLPKSIDPRNGGLSSVSCATASFCVAVDSDGDSLTYNGTSWSPPVSVGNSMESLNSVSCVTPSFCVAVAISEAFTYFVPVTSMTVLTLSATKVTYGDEQVEQLSVTVSPQSSGSMPTGTVTVNESTMTLCTIELSSGKGSCKLSAKKLNAGTYKVLATYGGSTNFYGSASAKRTFMIATAISKATLQLSAPKVTYGDEQVEHLSVAVSPQYPGTTPTGTVTVKASTGTLCVIKLSSGEGSCRLTPKKLKVRTYQIFATYGGSTNFKDSTSARGTLTVAT
jgi:hypothetical protein